MKFSEANSFVRKMLMQFYTSYIFLHFLLQLIAVLDWVICKWEHISVGKILYINKGSLLMYI